MRTLVEVREWEHTCRGAGFRVGDAATWDLSSADPASTPAEVPHGSVTGTVRAIIGVTYPPLPVTGERGSFVPDTEHPSLTALSEVGGGTSRVFCEYLVDFDVADDGVLPGFVVSEWKRDQLQAGARETAKNRARREDPVGAAASIVRDQDRSAITIEPHGEGATAARWARGIHDTDDIGIPAGDGSWRLPATVENAALARVFLDAASAGRATEEVLDRDGAAKRLDTCVRSAGGRRWVSSTEFDPVVEDDDVMLVFGDAFERVRRGSRSYASWKISA